MPIDAPPMDHTSAGRYLVEEAGAWQYFSHLGDSYLGVDPFRVRVTDAEGESTSAEVTPLQVWSSASGGGACPIVLDLDNDGLDLIHPDDSSIFADVNGDGWRERIGRAAPLDAVLVFDANEDGRADLEREVSFVGYQPGARTDLEGLVAFDTDGDGRITDEDADWQRLALFQDANGNGRQEEGEFRSPEDAGVPRSASSARAHLR